MPIIFSIVLLKENNVKSTKYVFSWYSIKKKQCPIPLFISIDSCLYDPLTKFKIVLFSNEYQILPNCRLLNDFEEKSKKFDDLLCAINQEYRDLCLLAFIDYIKENLTLNLEIGLEKNNNSFFYVNGSIFHKPKLEDWNDNNETLVQVTVTKRAMPNFKKEECFVLIFKEVIILV